MEKIKSILITLLAAFVVFSGFGTTEVNAQEKVKVYIFEAGGCPYCEAEMEYLESLDSYNVKFEVITKQLYIDHVNWEPGEDFQLGKKVAEAFNAAGFEDASYKGTPLVVISDIYAASAYSPDLEKYIDQAYEEGDRDVVSCIANDGDECIRGQKKDHTETITTIVLLVIIAGSVAVVVYAGKRNTSKEEDVQYEKDYENKVEEVKEEKVVKASEKKEVKKVEKTPAKKKTNTKASSKKNTSKKK